jgi:hypothetical protein
MKKVLLQLFILTGFSVSYAQSYQIINNAVGKLDNFEAILEKDELFGYVEVLNLDLDEKKVQRFKYNVLDKNMNSICTGEFTEDLEKKKSRKSNYQVEYNNGFIMFGLSEAIKRSNYYEYLGGNYKILDIKKNKIVASGDFKGKTLSESNFMNAMIGEGVFTFLPLSDVGFLMQQSVAGLFNFYSATGFDGETIWNLEPRTDSDKMSSYLYSYLRRDENHVVFSVELQKRGKKISESLAVHDAKTGAEVSFTDLSNKDYTLRFSNVFIEGEKTTIVGRYFEKDKRDIVKNEESLGLYRRVVDMKSGKIIEDKFLPYSAFGGVEINDNGRVKKEGYLSFQRIDKMPDQSYFILAETYNKKKQGAIYSEVFSFFLDKDFNFTKAESFDAKRTRGSKFSFVQNLANNAGKAYMFYDKNDDKDLELNVLNITYENMKTSKYKLPIVNDKSTILVIPAKTGYVAIKEYFKNPKKGEKLMEVRLEKLNYELD